LRENFLNKLVYNVNQFIFTPLSLINDLKMEKTLTSNESLAIITEMIAKAKKESTGDGGFQMLLWGWVIAVCNFGHYTLEKLGYAEPYIVWTLVIPAAIISFVKGFRSAKNAPAKSHLTTVLSQLWIIIFISMIVVLVFMGTLDFQHNPIILLLAGVGIFTTGTLVRENLVRWGGILLLLAAFIGFLLPVTEQYLVAGIGIVVGYLVPGYHLKKKSLERV
jgi:hypothetical protein